MKNATLTFSKILRAGSVLFIAVLLFTASTTFAQPTPGTSNVNPPAPGTVVTTPPNVAPKPLENPIPSITSVPGFVQKLLDIVLTIGVPIVAFFLIVSGFMFVAARGSAEKLETAKRTLLYTLIGAALLLGAWVFAQAIAGTINELK